MLSGELWSKIQIWSGYPFLFLLPWGFTRCTLPSWQDTCLTSSCLLNLSVSPVSSKLFLCNNKSCMFPQTHRTSASVCDLLGLFLFCTPLHTYLPSLPSSVKFISGKKPAPRQKQHSSYVLPLFLEKTVIIITGLYVCKHLNLYTISLSMSCLFHETRAWIILYTGQKSSNYNPWAKIGQPSIFLFVAQKLWVVSTYLNGYI